MLANGVVKTVQQKYLVILYYVAMYFFYSLTNQFLLQLAVTRRHEKVRRAVAVTKGAASFLSPR